MSQRKPKLTPRNPHVVPSLNKKAGAHRKTNKALRRIEKSRGGLAYRVEQGAFNAKVASSSLAAPTIEIRSQ